MKAYEYKVIECAATGVPLGEGASHGQRLQSGLNELGSEGWELCDTFSNMIVMKRQCPTKLSKRALERERNGL